MRYLSLNYCDQSSIVSYTINRKGHTFQSSLPLLVVTGYNLYKPRATVFIDNSGSLSDEKINIIRNTVECFLFQSSVVTITITSPDERWLNWFKLESPQNITYAFINESSPYFHLDSDSSFADDLMEFLSSSPINYGFLFIINNQGYYSENLIKQADRAWGTPNFPRDKYKKFIIPDVVGNKFISKDSLLSSNNNGGTNGSNGNPNDNDSGSNVLIDSNLLNLLKSTTLNEQKKIEIFYPSAEFLVTIVELLDRIVPKSPPYDEWIPDFLFNQRALSELSDTPIDVNIYCKNSCDNKSFAIDASNSLGYECFPYNIAISNLKEINKHLDRLQLEWR